MLLVPLDLQGDFDVTINVMERVDDAPGAPRRGAGADADRRAQMLAGRAAEHEGLHGAGCSSRSGSATRRRFFAEAQGGAPPGGNGIGPEAPTAEGAQAGMTPQGPQSGQTNSALAGAHGLSQSPEMLAGLATRAASGVGG